MPAKTDPTAKYLPVAAAADHFGVGVATLRRGIRNGELDHCVVRWGTAIRIDRHALEQHLAATRRVVTDDTAA
jgi:excisionase family DNA binding protein